MAGELTLESLYQNVLGRGSDPSGATYWSQQFGSTIDPNEIAAFTAAAQAEKPGAIYSPSDGGVASLPAASNYADLVQKAYTNVLGRPADVPGQQYWQSQLTSGALTPDSFQSAFKQSAAPELSVQQLYQDVLGRSYDPSGLGFWTEKIGAGGITPEERQQFYSAAIPEIVSTGYQNVLGRAPDEGSKYWTDVLSSSNLSPKDFSTELAKAAQGADFIPGQQYLALGPQSYLTDFQKYQPAIEKKYGLTPGSLASIFTQENLAGKSPEEIQQIIQQSGANKYQEASRIANLSKNLYGYTDEQAQNLVGGLLKGESVDPKAKEFYNQLLSSGMTKELQDAMIQDAAKRNPQAPIFQQNPALLYASTPIGELKSRPDGSGQYDFDPKTGLPIMSLKAARDMMGDKVILGAQQEFREKIGQDKLGYDPHSAWQGRLVNGVGIFGVDANKKEITDFDKIEKEIAKLGGVQTERDAEGNTRQVVYKDVYDPDSGRTVKQAVDVRSLFPMDEYTATDTYQKYLSNKENLNKAAASLGIDPSKYASTKEAYEDLNKRLENKWIVQGRTDSLPPEIAKSLGTDHATIQYEAIGDKLVPVKVLNTFNFKDPNTSRGVLGDLATGIGSILSVPPIAIAFAMMGGLPGLLTSVPEAALEYGATQGLFGTALGTPYAAGAANTLAGSIASGLGLEGQLGNLVGKSLLQAGTSGLMTGLKTGDLEKAGIGALAGGLGAGVSGGTSMLLKDLDISPAAKKVASEIAGGAAATSVTGQDPGAYALNRLLGAGISGLAGMGAEKAGIPTKGPEADLFKAMVPIITSKQVKPDDVVRLASAVNAFQKAA